MPKTVYDDCIGSTLPKDKLSGVPDYGWRVGLNYKNPQGKCKPWTSVRLKQALPLVTASLRYLKFWYGKKKEGKKPFIDNLHLLQHSPIYGVPIGGLGCGTIGRGYKGEFCRYQMVPGMYEHHVIPANQFIVCVRRGGVTVYQQVLSPTRPKNKKHLNSWQWGFDGANAVYHGLYPRSWTVYDLPGQDIRLTCRQISAVFPKDYEDTCLPLAVFVWDIENNSDTDVEVSITFTFKNGMGTKQDAQGGCRTEHFTTEGATAEGVMIHQTIKHMPCTYSVGAAHRAGVRLSHKLSFEPHGSGEELWTELWNTGHLKPGHPRGDDNPTVKGEEVGVAVCAQSRISARGTGQLEMCLTWDMPIIQFGARGKTYARRYCRWFGRDGKASPGLTRHCFKNYPFWEEKIEAWQNPILHNPNLPEWYKSALFNELYFITDGGTIWIDPVLDNETETNTLSKHVQEYGRFAYLEGHEYRMFNTYDVHHYASFALVMLWPELQLSIQHDFAELIRKEDLREVKYLYQGRPGPLKPINIIPHDVGDPEGEPWVDVNAYRIHPTYQWKDLNLKFVLQVYRDYVALKDLNFLRDMFPAVQTVMEFSLQWDTDNDGVIDNGGFPDQTYDAWTSTGASAYCGGIWLTACRMFIEMGKLLEKTDLLDKYQDVLNRGKKSFHDKLWNGRYYKYDASNSSHSDSIQADMLCGPWFLKASGLQDEEVFPSEFIKESLKTIFQYNVMSFEKGNMGAVNGMRPNGKKDLSSVQSDEFWVGTTYGLAATMIQEGMIEEGFQTASGPYHMCYESMGLAFQTPEAYFESREYRSLGYMRPLCIWSIQWALEKCQPHLLTDKQNNIKDTEAIADQPNAANGSGDHGNQMAAILDYVNLELVSSQQITI